MSKNKFEQLIELIINEDEAKAKELFHQIVVDKSRDIYEGLVSEENPIQQDLDSDSLGDEIESHQDVIDGDEMGDDIGDDFAGDDMGAPAGDEFAGDDMGGEAGLEDRVMDLEDAIDELKAEFDALMGEEEAEGHDFGGDEGDDDFAGDTVGDDFGGDEGASDSELDGDDAGSELDDEVPTEGKKFGEASIYGESRKTPADLMREYVEKVTAVKPSEGDAVGAGGTKTPINTKSVNIGGKNDMGGTSANIARGGNEGGNPTGPKKPSNAYSKGETKMGQDKYENSPGANTKGYKDKQTAKTKEGSDTAGSQTVAKKSIEPGGKPGFKG